MKRTKINAIFAVLLWAALATQAARCEELCVDGSKMCSDDAYAAAACEGGEWKRVECMRDFGMLCDSGECVDPWRYGSPAWPKAEDEPRATKESLAEKAAYFEEQAVRLHLHPKLKWINPVVLPCAKADCAPGQNPPCLDCSKAEPQEEMATWRDVESWLSGENDGLWNALYTAAQAFKYAVTRDEQTLKNIKLLLEGEATRMKITSVPGLLTRQYVMPGIPGLSAPEDLSHYTVDADKLNNKWVRIGDEGCVWAVDPATMQWRKSDHCGLEEFAGWKWLDNVSKDEYSGHMFMLASLSQLVDDEEVRATVADMAGQVGAHMVRNGMDFTDWDGRVTEHGKIRAGVMDDFVGFNAAMALSFIKVAHAASGNEKLDKWYRDCLLQKSGKVVCIKGKNEPARDYTKYLPTNGFFRGFEGCYSNYNGVSMHMLSLFDLIWLERDPELKEIYQQTLDADVMRAEGQPRAVINQNNAWFDFMWAAMKRVGPGSDGPAYGAVDNGIRMLKQFPARKRLQEIKCPPDKCKPYCEDRAGRQTGNYARPIAERCVRHFVWWGDPYGLGDCEADPRIVQPPQDYLLAYWMGRYFGFISEDM